MSETGRKPTSSREEFFQTFYKLVEKEFKTEEFFQKLGDTVLFHAVIVAGNEVDTEALRHSEFSCVKQSVQMEVGVRVEWKYTTLLFIRLDCPDDAEVVGGGFGQSHWWPKQFFDESPSAQISPELTSINVQDGLQVGAAGQEAIAKAQMLIYMFDLTRKSSLEVLERLPAADPSIPAILIASKTDLLEERAVDQKDIKNLFNKLNCVYYGEISTQTGEGVPEFFFKLLQVRKQWMDESLPKLCKKWYEDKKREYDTSSDSDEEI